MFKHGVLAIALATMIYTTSLEAADCGCSSCQQVQTCDCQSQCNSCCSPVLDFLTGVKYNIGVGFCNVREGVKRVFNPITFNGNCGCTARVSDCGCNTSFAPNQYGSPLIQIIDSPIQTQDTFIPNPPVPPTDESNIIIPEPARFKPGQWERASYQQQNSVRNPQLYYSRVMAERARLYGPTSHPTSYYAPVQRVGTR
ncbi:MAG: hypothetical protein ACKVH8_11910 [Pirellulales bacterium]